MSESRDKRGDPAKLPGGQPAPATVPPSAGEGSGASSRNFGVGRPTPPRSASARARSGELLVGRLTAHGRAHYQFRSGGDLSYYVKLLTINGERTLWGKDLDRAIARSETKPKVGDLVGARRVSRRAITITSRVRDTEGRIVRQDEHQAHRTRWVVEKVKFFAERARMARKVRDEQADVRESVRAHPELKSTFMIIRGCRSVRRSECALLGR